MAEEQVGVLGLGNFGTALAQHLARDGRKVLAWTKDATQAATINEVHRNPKYLSTIELSPTLRATNQLSELQSAGVVVVALPSKALDSVLPQLNLSDNALVVSVVKGLYGDGLTTPLQAVSQLMSNSPRLSVLSGPGFARDIAAHLPTGLVAASEDEVTARVVAELFSDDAIKVYVSSDPLGVELGGILKNVMALAVGMVDGLALGDSARAGLVTRGLAEMRRLATALGAQQETLFGLSGLGDLVLTATSDTSRNRTVGLRLGAGESLKAITESLGSTAEGVRTTPLVLSLAAEHGVEMPITAQVASVLSGKEQPFDALKKLVVRPLTTEFGG